jgi:hypothetical protein
VKAWCSFCGGLLKVGGRFGKLGLPIDATRDEAFWGRR